jgi:hypothetical protein
MKLFLIKKICLKDLLITKIFFKDTNHKIWQEIVDKIIAFEPEWVGYTSYTANITAIDIISKKLKV